MTPVNSGLIEQSDVIRCDDRLLFDVLSITYDIIRYNTCAGEPFLNYNLIIE